MMKPSSLVSRAKSEVAKVREGRLRAVICQTVHCCQLWPCLATDPLEAAGYASEFCLLVVVEELVEVAPA